MKPYRPMKRRLDKSVTRLQELLSGKEKLSQPVQYMEMKELSERMERARASAQFSVLCYKYAPKKNIAKREEMLQAIDEYLLVKQAYYRNYHRYMEQCRQTASWHPLGALHDPANHQIQEGQKAS